MKRVLFVCVVSAGRSQMAAAFANHLGEGRILAESAGTMPAEQVNPIVVRAMMEKGLDISQNRPVMLDLKKAKRADMIITMRCSVAEIYPAPLLKKNVDWGLKDPKGKSLEEVREIRDEIERTVQKLLSELHA